MAGHLGNFFFFYVNLIYQIGHNQFITLDPDSRCFFHILNEFLAQNKFHNSKKENEFVKNSFWITRAFEKAWDQKT